MKKSIRGRLLFSYFAVIFLVIFSIVITMILSLPNAYGRHLGNMEMVIESGRPMEMRNLFQGKAGELFRNFRLSIVEALAWAIIISFPIAIITSYFISRSLISPLRAMIYASQRIAEGHYQERVPKAGNDELGILSTSFNQMAEKLENVETRRRQLIGDVAHELRTPLTIIKGSMEGLIDGILPETTEIYSQIADEAERLTRLVDDLQELSRVEAGKINLHKKNYEINDLLTTAYKRIAQAFLAKGIELSLVLPEKNYFIRVDADRILQVLNNILVNSLQYTPAGGKVTIRSHSSHDLFRIEIKDNGIGISQEHLPYIFDRFYRADRSRVRVNGGGSGIGLTISKQLIEAHDGNLFVESPGEGQGSTFIIQLPYREK